MLKTNTKLIEKWGESPHFHMTKVPTRKNGEKVIEEYYFLCTQVLDFTINSKTEGGLYRNNFTCPLIAEDQVYSLDDLTFKTLSLSEKQLGNIMFDREDEIKEIFKDHREEICSLIRNEKSFDLYVEDTLAIRLALFEIFMRHTLSSVGRVKKYFMEFNQVEMLSQFEGLLQHEDNFLTNFSKFNKSGW